MSTSGVFVDSYEDERQCSVENAEGVECDFDGLVEVFYDSEAEEQWWTCPKCGYGHTMEWEDGYE